MSAAAFFDLDKTILAKSSSLAFAKPLYDGGLMQRSDVLKSAYAQMVFLTAGADHDQMEQMRIYLQKLCKGWQVEQVRAIVADTLDNIVTPIIHTEAVELIAEHQRAGRDVIVISSSGTEIVEPICAQLGVDRAVGTQLEVDENGCYTGEILFYAYGEGKAEAMRQLATEFGYDLTESFAYSDSHTDLPMLEIVGNPVAVNPDAELAAVARERGWKIAHFDKPESMKQARADRQRKALKAGGAAVALGLAWYARRWRKSH